MPVLVHLNLRRLEDHRTSVALIVAILLHLLFLLLFNSLSQLVMLTAAPLPAQAEPPPLAFEFVEVPDQDRDEVTPEQTPLLADRQSTARDASVQDTNSDVPNSEGDSEYGRQNETVHRQTEEVEGTSDAAGQSVDFASLLSESKETGSKIAREMESIYGKPALPPRAVRLENQASSARELGSFKLSTYEWDFAPYMKYLKKVIESNISPPPAFSHFGLIEGKTWVKFRILPDGRLEGLEVVRHEGNEGSDLLAETSLRAVSSSADFRKLPANFPDEYLEISGLFEYIIYRPGRRQEP